MSTFCCLEMFESIEPSYLVGGLASKSFVYDVYWTSFASYRGHKE